METIVNGVVTDFKLTKDNKGHYLITEEYEHVSMLAQLSGHGGKVSISSLDSEIFLTGFLVLHGFSNNREFNSLTYKVLKV